MFNEEIEKLIDTNPREAIELLINEFPQTRSFSPVRLFRKVCEALVTPEDVKHPTFRVYVKNAWDTMKEKYQNIFIAISVLRAIDWANRNIRVLPKESFSKDLIRVSKGYTKTELCKFGLTSQVSIGVLPVNNNSLIVHLKHYIKCPKLKSVLLYNDITRKYHLVTFIDNLYHRILLKCAKERYSNPTIYSPHLFEEVRERMKNPRDKMELYYFIHKLQDKCIIPKGSANAIDFETQFAEWCGN